jgi:hypothetical protein
MTVPAGAQISEDGQYWWDGQDWQPTPGGSASTEQSVETGQLSDDGYYRWDGTAWQPVDQSGDQDAGGQATTFDPGAFQNLFSLANMQSEDQAEAYTAALGIDLSDTDEATA